MAPSSSSCCAKDKSKMARLGLTTDPNLDSGESAAQSSTIRRFSSNAGTLGVKRVERRTGVTTLFFCCAAPRDGVANKPAAEAVASCCCCCCCCNVTALAAAAAAAFSPLDQGDQTEGPDCGCGGKAGCCCASEEHKCGAC